jgi:N-acetylneuraminate synthase
MTKVDATASTFVIAEAGVNHNGTLRGALDLIDVAAAAGADAVKFQTFSPGAVAAEAAPKARYQRITTGEGEGQLEMLKRLALPSDAIPHLVERAQDLGITFMSTAFDDQSLRLLAGLGVAPFKISSGDITNAPLLLETARYRRAMIVSTGMCSLADVEEALGVIAFGLLGWNTPSKRGFCEALNTPEGQRALKGFVTLLHCVTEYPTPLADVNLRAMDTLGTAFGLPVGYSDHTAGTAIALASVARGARVLEKHFTTDRGLPGPDHEASIEPGELRQMVLDVRAIEVALGSGRKAPSMSERANLAVARRSLVAARAIEKGEEFSADNLAAKRPAGGREPSGYWETLGEKAERAYQADEMI